MVSHIASAAQATVAFWGAARTVTGSMHLVEVGGCKLLLDCGAARGSWQEMRRRNGAFPFHATQLDAVLLSHAHNDHAGNLPILVRHGFTGPILCTAATRDLLAVTLSDSARFKEADARVLRILDREWSTEGLPLFSREDVETTLRQCETLSYDQPREIFPGIEVQLVNAGHLLGAAMIALKFRAGGRDNTLTFTGDLGRRGIPLVSDPSPIPPSDFLLCESTYGGRTHQPMEQVRARLADVLRRTAERGGKVFIPAFSLGRTQTVVHTIRQEIQAGRAPHLPIFVDSPLAADVADVYRRHGVTSHLEPIGFNGDDAPQFVRDPNESRELSRRREPCVVVASGGMCEGGRILQHLKHNLDDPRCSVVLVSYQAPATPGWQLLERRPTVRFHGKSWNKWAEVIDLNGFSTHADHNELLNQLAPLAGGARTVCLVHGELDRAEALQDALQQLGFVDVIIPAEGQILSV
jgi:metallo-beta-lactamase family protein